MWNENSIELINEITHIVLEEPEPNYLATALALRTFSHLECRGFSLGVIRNDGFIDLIGSYGYPFELTKPINRIPLWTPLPITDAARTGESSIKTITKESAASIPNLSEWMDSEEMYAVAAPINFRSGVIGAFALICKVSPPKNFLETNTTNSLIALIGIYIRNWIRNESSKETKDYIGLRKSLSTRQKEIIKLFKLGITTEQMAGLLSYSPSTIKHDIIKIYELLGVRSRIEVMEILKLVDLAG